MGYNVIGVYRCILTKFYLKVCHNIEYLVTCKVVRNKVRESESTTIYAPGRSSRIFSRTPVNVLIGESIYDQNTPNPKQIDTKRFFDGFL